MKTSKSYIICFLTFLIKIVNHFDAGIHAHFWFFSLNLSDPDVISYTYPLRGEGEIATHFMVQTIKSCNWDILGFFHDYRILSVTISHFKWEKLNQQDFYIFACIFAPKQNLSFQYLIFFVWMSVLHWISSCIYKVKTESTVAQRISPIFLWHTLGNEWKKGEGLV